MPNDQQHLKVEDEMTPPWRVWRVDEDGRQISVVAEAQTRVEVVQTTRRLEIQKLLQPPTGLLSAERAHCSCAPCRRKSATRPLLLTSRSIHLVR
jgi:hypothetical protein